MIDDIDQESYSDMNNLNWTVEEDDVVCFTQNSIISREEVLLRIRELCADIYRQMTSSESSEDVTVSFNERGSAHNSQVDSILGVRVQYDTPKKQSFSLVKNPHRFAIFTRVLSLIYTCLMNNVIVTKRSLFYQDIDLFLNQHIVDGVIEDISCCLEIPRTSLGVTATQRGLVAGPLQFVIDGEIVIDCSEKVEQIPMMVDLITAQKTNAVAVLVVEKESIFQRLVQSTIVREVIIVTGRGMPDYATRLFLKLLEDSFDLPIVGLFDGDAYGILIFFVYRFGAKSSAYDGMNMAVASMKWLGVRPSDFERMVPKKRFLELTQNDCIVIERLQKEKNIPEVYLREIALIKEYNKKCEIEALIGSDNLLIDHYLPQKFANHDWL